MRLFFGIPVQQPASDALADWCAQLPDQHGWHWVDERNWHITLAFLGEIDGTYVNALCELGEAVAANHSACKITLEQLQWWPSASRPRLLVAANDSSGPLAPLRKQLAQGLRELGVNFDGKPLRPHVTLMRLERGAIPLLLDLPKGHVDVDVEAIALYSSERIRGEIALSKKQYRPLWQRELNLPLPPFKQRRE